MSDSMPKRDREADMNNSANHTPPRGTNATPATRRRNSNNVNSSSATSPAQPTTVPGSPSHATTAGRDPQLESLLDRLDIDDDFKDSIRALSPTSQREVLNDIVRQQHHEHASAFLAGTDTAYGGTHHHHHHSGRSDSDEEYEEEDDEEDDFEDLGAEQRVQGPFMMLGGPQAGGFRVGDEAYDDNPMQFLMQQVLPTLFGGQPQGQGQQRGTGGPVIHVNGRPVHTSTGNRLQEMLRQHLQEVMSEWQQVNAMRAMGMDRDIDDMSYEELLALEERLGSVNKGLDSEAKMDACFDRLPEPPKDGSCPICLDEFTPSSALTTPGKPSNAQTGSSAENPVEPPSRSSSVTEVRPCVSLKNCGHSFHEVCIKTWMRSDKTCPVCKREVIPPR